MILTSIFRMGQGQMCNMPFESPYMTFHSLSVVTCTISVIVCEIIAFELSIYCRHHYFSLKQKVKVMGNNVADYTLDAKLLGRQLGEKNAVLSQTVLCVVPNNQSYALHFIGSPMLKIAKFFEFFTLKISNKITKAHNGFGTSDLSSALAEKMTNKSFQIKV